MSSDITLTQNLALAFQAVAEKIRTSSGGGDGLIVGQVISSVIPLTLNGVIPLNGTILSADNVNNAGFVSHVIGLQTDYPELFITDAEWQSKVSALGECEKFVIGTDDDGVTTLRIPKLSDVYHKTRFYIVLSA